MLDCCELTNQATRLLVLERDNYTCQLDLLFGIARLSGAECVDRLEVHHRHYENYDSEIPEDLITVCSRCHNILTNYVKDLHLGLQASYDAKRFRELTADSEFSLMMLDTDHVEQLRASMKESDGKA